MISVVIPVKDRSQDLQRCLRSVEESYLHLVNSTRPYELEILVIDDHSEEDLYEATIDFSSVRVIKNEGIGPGAARNLGMRESKSEIVGFIDSDCIADHNWLLRIVEKLGSGLVMALQGNPCLFMKEQNPKLGACEEKLYLALFKTYIDDEYSIQIDTRNCAFHKNIFESLGEAIFITDMKQAQAEARVCGNNLVNKGIRIHYDDTMLVYHKDPSSIRASMRQKVRHGSGRIFVWEDTPSISHIFRRYYWTPVMNHKIPAWYVIPVHTAFLWGYIKAKIKLKDGKSMVSIFLLSLSYSKLFFSLESVRQAKTTIKTSKKNQK